MVLAGEMPVYRFFNANRGGHLYTISPAERDYIMQNLPHYSYEGIKFAVHKDQAADTTAVYRFFNTRTGIHLYTISEVERDYILANLPHYNYEGIKFYVSGATPQTTPVYRFFNNVRGGHLYTISEVERDTLLQLPQWDYEGVKFHVLDAAGIVYETDSIVGNLRCIPAGRFIQGSPATEPCRDSDEGPQFTHILTRNLAVMETEVTRGMWAELKAVQPTLPNDISRTDVSPTMDHPAQSMHYEACFLFANLLSLQQGFTQCYYADEAFTEPIDLYNYLSSPTIYWDMSANGYRLPTEGEWEYFCRAGTVTPFSVNEPNYDGTTCEGYIPGLLPMLESVAAFVCNYPDMCAVAGSLAANPWNLHDVHGNVFEWCWDWYGDYPEGTQTDYTGPEHGSGGVLEAHVSRGGSWGYFALDCRSATRNNLPFGKPFFGLRLVRSIP